MRSTCARQTIRTRRVNGACARAAPGARVEQFCNGRAQRAFVAQRHDASRRRKVRRAIRRSPPHRTRRPGRPRANARFRPNRRARPERRYRNERCGVVRVAHRRCAEPPEQAYAYFQVVRLRERRVEIGTVAGNAEQRPRRGRERRERTHQRSRALLGTTRPAKEDAVFSRSRRGATARRRRRLQAPARRRESSPARRRCAARGRQRSATARSLRRRRRRRARRSRAIRISANVRGRGPYAQPLTSECHPQAAVPIATVQMPPSCG